MAFWGRFDPCLTVRAPPINTIEPRVQGALRLPGRADPSRRHSFKNVTPGRLKLAASCAYWLRDINLRNRFH